MLYSRFLTDDEIETFYKHYFEGPPYHDICGENRQHKPYSRIQLQRKDDTMFVISTQKFS